MYNVGIFPGKFTPPHRGHLNAIINASTKCNKLYVVVSDNPVLTARLCSDSNLPIMDMRLRTKWLSQELQGFDHISVIMLDESGVPEYPEGWPLWSKKLLEIMPEPFDVIFGGELEYKQFNDIYFPDKTYEVFDYNREKYPISATQIRNNPIKYWDYILGSARPFFAKKVLIAGTESCGKTTLTKYLAKMYHTSWAEEEGRYYSTRFLGGNEQVFEKRDFELIVYQQYEKDMQALRDSNKIVFYDSDALITQYYLGLYLGQHSETIDKFIEPNRYDKVLFMTPSVKWVPDGFRWNSEDETRWELHAKLKNMYHEYGFGDKLIEVTGDYTERLKKCELIIDKILE